MPFRTTRRVEFRDTDAAGIVHFSAFFPMMESAEHEMLRSLGIAVMPHGSPGEPPLTWPRVSASCDYLAAARFEDELAIDVAVDRIGKSSVRYAFLFSRDDVPVVRGSIVVVACLLTAGGLKKTTVPDDVRALLEAVPS